MAAVTSDGIFGAGRSSGTKVCTDRLPMETEDLHLCNARSLSSVDGIPEFEDELDRTKFAIIGICETRRKGEGCLTLNNSSRQFYYKGGN